MKLVFDKGRNNPVTTPPPSSEMKVVDNTVRTVQKTLEINKIQIQLTRMSSNGTDTISVRLLDADVLTMYSSSLFLDEKGFEALIELVSAGADVIKEWRDEEATDQGSD